MRVASLFPSGTEIAAAVGADVVAVSHQCDYPPAVADRPTLSGYHGAPGAPDPEDDRVAASDGTYYVDREALAAAEPDVVLSQGLCAVCAVDGGLAVRAVETLDLDATVVSLDARTLSDVFENVERVGEATGREAAADELLSGLRERVDRVRGQSRTVEERPRTAVLDWLDPLRSAGLWAPELVELAGGEPGLAAPGERSRKLSAEELADFDPEVLVASPCGRGLDEAAAELSTAAATPALTGLSAVRGGRTYALDGTAHVSRHSHRVVDSLERLAELLHPKTFGSPPAAAVRRVDGRA